MNYFWSGFWLGGGLTIIVFVLALPDGCLW